MIGGHGFWMVVWSAILLLGVVGLWASATWKGEAGWDNLDEVLRAVGTILVSAGMLLLLSGHLVQVATGCLGLAFGVFVAAFVAGRNLPDPLPDDVDEDDDEESHPALRSRTSGAVQQLDTSDDPGRTASGPTSFSNTGGAA